MNIRFYSSLPDLAQVLRNTDWNIDFLHFLSNVGPVPRTGLTSRRRRDEGIGPYNCRLGPGITPAYLLTFMKEGGDYEMGLMKFILRNWFNHHIVLNGHHFNPVSFFKLFCHQLFCQFFVTNFWKKILLISPGRLACGYIPF